jgi:hypothetical protein
LIGGYKRSQPLEVLQIGARIVVRSFQNERSVFQLRMASDTSQGVCANVSLADVPMAIDAGVVWDTGVVEVNGANVFSLHCFLDALNESLKTVFFTNVVARGESVCGVKADAERELWTDAHDRFEVLETMTDAVALSGSVFEQDAELPELQSFARNLQTCRA